jgi:hypothetical protein
MNRAGFGLLCRIGYTGSVALKVEDDRYSFLDTLRNGCPRFAPRVPCSKPHPSCTPVYLMGRLLEEEEAVPEPWCQGLVVHADSSVSGQDV